MTVEWDVPTRPLAVMFPEIGRGLTDFSTNL